MVWPPPRFQDNPLFPVLKYSHSFSYPLTASEAWFWQIQSRFSQYKVDRYLADFPHLQGYYFLPGPKKLVKTRLTRRRSSRLKWSVAAVIVKKLIRIPSIEAIFITGALSMDNSPANDDIDIMIVTAPHTMWTTRFLVNIFLRALKVRRDPHLPEHSSPRVKDKICDNLWVDSRHLNIFTHNLYQAHEILQAKCVFDRGGIQYAFLSQNAWVGEYLPIAYRESLKNLKKNKLSSPSRIVYWPVNLLFYFLQYLYMLPHRHTERIGLGFALFHSRPEPECDMIEKCLPPKKLS